MEKEQFLGGLISRCHAVIATDGDNIDKLPRKKRLEYQEKDEWRTKVENMTNPGYELQSRDTRFSTKIFPSHQLERVGGKPAPITEVEREPIPTMLINKIKKGAKKGQWEINYIPTDEYIAKVEDDIATCMKDIAMETQRLQFWEKGRLQFEKGRLQFHSHK